MKTNELYELWCQNVREETLKSELFSMKEEDINDAFYRELEFGTAGLRGVLGAGTNRMNVYTVGRVAEAIARYVEKKYPEAQRKIAISYDTRHQSDTFAELSASVFSAHGICVYLYDQPMPTPCLSYATRAYGCAVGVMITASHNPSKYNGYKVYGADGCQIDKEIADEILGIIEEVDTFSVAPADFATAMKKGIVSYVTEEVIADFLKEVKNTSVLKNEKIDKNVAIVYSPLHGTGRVPVLRALKENGFDNVTVVKEQEMPDGDFTTCPYPNPEIREAMALGMAYAKKCNADLLLATDPDCDRVGIAVKNKNGEHVLLTGNQVGCLLLDYICGRRIANGTMPKNPVLVKTIVTTDLADRIADSYGVRTINILTGFKYIGEQIALLEKAGHPENYILGFEESYGYLTGTYVRDKDAVNASLLICEMFAYYKSLGISLLDRLGALYAKFGYCLNRQDSYGFAGESGFHKMEEIMNHLRCGMKTVGEWKVEGFKDYAGGIDGLPKANVLKFTLDKGCSFIVRPSGTEPKIKIYLTVVTENQEKAEKIAAELKNATAALMA